MSRWAVLSTFTHRSSDLADIPIVFKPGTDLAILNYIANHIITTGHVNQDFVKNHTTFVKGAVDIGYGLRADIRSIKAKGAADPWRDPADRLRRLCSLCKGLHARQGIGAYGCRTRLPAGARRLYADPKRKVMSLWTMGFNQHVRGVWANQLALQSPSADGKDLRTRQFAVLADGATVRLRHGA